jgi:hypothetical protein
MLHHVCDPGGGPHPICPDRMSTRARMGRTIVPPDRLIATEESPRPAMRIALYEPDIPQNTGTILRLCACLGIAAHIIEPAGFPVTDRAFRRAGMDYLDQVTLTRHTSFSAFEDWRARERLSLVLLTQPQSDHTSITHSTPTRCCCSAARALAFRKRCTRQPTPVCASRCGRACVRSMLRWRSPW